MEEFALWDYRRLNSITPQWYAHMPELSEILAKVCRTHVLSKMDLNKDFHQVPLDPNTREKTTISTPFSRYCYTKMPFGIKNAPAIFQDLMQRVLADCQDCATVYIDDIIIYSQNETEHAAHVTRVLSALRAAGLTAKASKCQWGQVHTRILRSHGRRQALLDPRE